MELGAPLLLVRARSHLCAFPLAHVAETMRRLPIQPVPVAPDFILGLSVIRGEPTPVVDLGRLLGYAEEPRTTRLVSVRLGERRAALAVEEVLRTVHGSAVDRWALPPLLRGAGDRSVAALSTLDQDFLSILEAAHLVPEDVWGRLAAPGARR